MRRILSILAAAAVCVASHGQQAEQLAAILALTGAGTEENLDEDLMAHYHALGLHPLRINNASMARLSSCGLFTPYQAASIVDYRATYGDILSAAELGCVDGIGESLAAALAPFLDFSGDATGPSARKLRAESTLRTGLALSKGEFKPSATLKTDVEYMDRAEMFMAMRNGGTGVAASSLALRSRSAELLLGDYNVRIGQGLLVWSGFSLAGFPSASAFSRHPTGISQSRSLSPMMRGVAGRKSFGHTTAMAFWNARGASGAGVNTVWCNGQCGLTALGSGAFSADLRVSVRRLDLFGEAAYDIAHSAAAAVAGVIWNPEYQTRLALLLRAYPGTYDAPQASPVKAFSTPRDEYGAAVGAEWKGWNLTLDGAVRPVARAAQVKMVLSGEIDAGELVDFRLRGNMRWRPFDEGPKWRVDLRSDALLSLGAFSATCRVNLLHCEGFGALGYLEAGYKSWWSAYLRGTVYSTGSWNDRIYSYERDFPGSFSCPAYYGRGAAASAMLSAQKKKGRFKATAGLKASISRSRASGVIYLFLGL